MVCIYCGSGTAVTNSRTQKQNNSTWRRRRCKSCGAVTTSIEITDLSKSLVVTDRSGAFSGFQRYRLFLDVYDSLKHRKTALEDAAALTDTIIQRILANSVAGSVRKQAIIAATAQTLGAFDNIAATHYTAYHPV